MTCHTTDLEVPQQCGVSQSGIIPGFGPLIRFIPQHGLVSLFVPHKPLVRAHQVRPVGIVSQKLLVIGPHSVDNDVAHGQDHSQVRARQYGNPFCRLASREVAYGIKYDIPHPPRPCLGCQPHIMSRAMSGPCSLVGAELNGQVAIVVVRKNRPGTVD